MKKIILLLAIAIMGNYSTKAQGGERLFKRFKGDVSLGLVASTGSNSDVGILFSMEPKLALMDKLSIGLRMEGAAVGGIMFGESFDAPRTSNEKVYGSYVATADYYFTTNYSFRPFVGAGAGIFGQDDVSSVNYNDQSAVVKFGGIIRTGAEIKHFRFGIEYNFIANSSGYFSDNQGNQIPATLKNGYFGIKAGFCFGGGPLR